MGWKAILLIFDYHIDGRVINEYVDFSPRLLHRRDHSIHSFRVADIRRIKLSISSSPTDFLAGFRSARIDVIYRDDSAVFSKCQSNRFADTSFGARNQRHTPV